VAHLQIADACAAQPLAGPSAVHCSWPSLHVLRWKRCSWAGPQLCILLLPGNHRPHVLYTSRHACYDVAWVVKVPSVSSSSFDRASNLFHLAHIIAVRPTSEVAERQGNEQRAAQRHCACEIDTLSLLVLKIIQTIVLVAADEH
jgi:hypothetical protein